MIHRGLSNRQSEFYGGGRYKPSKREAKVINLTASTTQKLQMPLCANLHPILCPILVVSLSYSTCKSYKISYAETRRRFRYRVDELGGYEAVSLVRVILVEGLGRSRGYSRWKVAFPLVAGKWVVEAHQMSSNRFCGTYH